jgi:hypothetical protein
MKQTVILALGVLALTATAASAQGDFYNCYKAKDLKTPQFVATTFNVMDEFGTQREWKQRSRSCTAPAWTAQAPC